MSVQFNFPTLRESVAHDLRSESGAEFTPLLSVRVRLLRRLVLGAIVGAIALTGVLLYTSYASYVKALRLEDAVDRAVMEVSTLRSTVVAMNEDEEFAHKVSALRDQTFGLQPLTVRLLSECEQFGKVSEWDLKVLNHRMNQLGLTLEFIVESGNALQMLDQLEHAARSAGWQMTRGDPQFNDSGIQITLYFTPKGLSNS